MPTTVYMDTCKDASGFHRPNAVDWNLKGGLGQALVQKYFEYAGWAAVPTGIEAAVDHIMQLHGVRRGDLGNLPDLVVSKLAGSAQNPKTRPLGQAFYVEVKTWEQWTQDGADMDPYRQFGTVLLVWVSPNGLQGVWLSRPTEEGNVAVAGDPRRVVESDFRPLEVVGGVSLRHCGDDACENRLREAFHRMAKLVARLPSG